MGNRRADVKTDSETYISIEIGTEGWQREYAHLPLIESEYLRDEGPRRAWDKYTPDDNFWTHPNISRNVYKIGSEIFAVRQVEHWWDKMGKKSYHSGGANWVFSDGTHGGRNPTEVTRASGEVDAVRLKKEAFFTTKAMWRPEAQIHVVGHWNYEAGTQKTMYVVSNCTKVKLYINDKLIATDDKADKGYLFKFPKVNFEAGEIKVEGYLNDKLLVSQTKKTVGEAVGIKLSSIVGPKGWLADGSDIALVDFEIVDKDGNRHPLGRNKVDFTISGPGIWRGGYNGGKPNTTNNLFLDAEAGINRVAIRSMLQAGDVTITASSEGLKSASITLTSKSIDLVNGMLKEMPQQYTVDFSKGEPLPIYTPKSEPYNPTRANKSDLFTKFSYTGDGKAMLRSNVHWGKKAYTDLEYNYTVIPKYLVGAEYIRIPNSDGKYWARDQLQFIAGAAMEIYVGHDDRVERPKFLLLDYKDTGDDINLQGVKMSLFKRVAKKGESIIMAGNSDGDVPDGTRMYFVIGKKIKK
jgi:beta-galactosidase